MNISVFGMGYVGCVGMACLAKMGHSIIGVDVSETKVSMINKGLPTIIEKDVDDLIKEGLEKKRIRATVNYSDAVHESDLSFICVGTPNSRNGHLDLKYIEKVAGEIAEAISRKSDFHTIVIRSTVLPGTTESIASLIEKKSGKKAGDGFCVLANPEFLREGNAVEDYFNPGITVIGGSHKGGIALLAELYHPLHGTIQVVETRVAETIKLLNNSWHALKVTFANEVGMICKSIGVNTDQLIDIFLQDNRLNISSAYLKPGFAYGGSCLPKDLKALQLISHDNYQNTPVLNSVDKSNKAQIERAVQIIEQMKKRKIGVWGISFKEGTDDLRNSPVIDVIETLIGKGYHVSAYDKNVNASFLIGANKDYITSKLPHFESIMVDNLQTLIENSDVLVVNTKGEADDYQRILNHRELVLLDLKNIPSLRKHTLYEGFNW